jgi:bifunctional non-homologous end joining protein LigD
MSLQKYNRKRHFTKTPEPVGKRQPSAGGNQFVVQKHAASRLHYDFRLELDGALKSWAIPKGPSLNPKVKALAVQVEDHPLDYAGFEGVIPKGQYGGGTVMVWDHGTWESEGNAARDLRRGKLKFRLMGEKLRGGWSLVRMGGKAGEDGKNWLLIKQQDSDALSAGKTEPLARRPRSVLSNRTLEEIAADADRVWSSNGKAAGTGRQRARGVKSTKVRRAVGRRVAKFAGSLAGARSAPQPDELHPQLATLSAEVPQGDRWLHELKFDGYRILAFFTDGKVRLVTRQGNDWSARFGPIVDALKELPISNGILDGEIVSLDEQGVPDFQQLQNSLKRGSDNSLVYYLFDVPHLEQFDLTDVPLVDRKELVLRLVRSITPEDSGPVRYSDHIRGQGEQIWQHACRGALEGIVSKLADGRYKQSRSTSWLKVKCLKRQEFVIGGFTKPSGARTDFGALLLGYYDGNDLRYCGRVGTGFTHESLRQVKAELRRRTVEAAPFINPPRGAPNRHVTWVRPELVCEVEFSQWTRDGILRHPSFQGLREDKDPQQVTREVPRRISEIRDADGMTKKSKLSSRTKSPKRTASADALEVAGMQITNPDRVVYPEQRLTKLQLAGYYETIAEWILPHVAERPLTLVRCPTGRTGQCFYQKHLGDAAPMEVGGVMIREKNSRNKYIVIRDLKGLIALVQIGVLEIHPWPARADNVERPDRLVFDLDPGEGVPWNRVVRAARDVRDFLAEVGLVSFLRTSEGKGLHVVAPLVRRNSWDELKSFAKGVAEKVTTASPDRYVATMSKTRRVGKVFIDYLRNQRGATAIASYSTRARVRAPVATPLDWSELSGRTKPDMYRVENLPKRIASKKVDPWDGFFDIRQSLTRPMLSRIAG